MRLIYAKSGTPVSIGDKVITRWGDEVRVDHFNEPHKPASEGTVTVKSFGAWGSSADGPVGLQGSREYYVGVIGAEWVEREDRAAQPLMRNGKPLKTLPDGAPRRMSDGKNSWRKMNDAQRSEFLDWIADAPDAPATDVAKRVTPDDPTTWEGYRLLRIGEVAG